MRLGRNALTLKDKKRITDLFESGMSMADIAKRFNCSLNPIQGIIREYKRQLDYANGKDIEERKKETKTLQNL